MQAQAVYCRKVQFIATVFALVCLECLWRVFQLIDFVLFVHCHLERFVDRFLVLFDLPFFVTQAFQQKILQIIFVTKLEDLKKSPFF